MISGCRLDDSGEQHRSQRNNEVQQCGYTDTTTLPYPTRERPGATMKLNTCTLHIVWMKPIKRDGQKIVPCRTPGEKGNTVDNPRG